MPDETGSFLESLRTAGWVCSEPGRYRRLVPPRTPSFSWLSPAALVRSRNDIIARRLGDPTNEIRRRWVRSQLEDGAPPDLVVTRYGRREEISFLVLGDPGEGDASQYAVVPPLLQHKDTDFMFLCSDVVYPAGDAGDYETKFYLPYRDYPSPIYAIPGNHDWYDGLNGFMLHFCRADGSRRPLPDPTEEPGLRPWARRLLWRSPAPPDRARIDKMRSLRGAPGQQATQPGPYFAIDAGPVLLLGLDTGITGVVDRAQGDWLFRMSGSTPQPKILLTGSPLVADAVHQPCPIEGGGTVDEIVRAPSHNYIAAIGANLHNYQRYPVKLGNGRVIQYVVNGGGGAYTTATHRIPQVDLPGVTEEEFRSYPLRSDSLSLYSRNFDRRLAAGKGLLMIPPDQAGALIAERLGIPPAPENRGTRVPLRSRLAMRIIYPRGDRPRGPMHHYISEIFDWNDPPLFKSLLRVDASAREVKIRCYAATGCLAQEETPTVADEITARPDGRGKWRWTDG